MTTIPVGSIPQPTTPPSGGSTPRLALTPRAQSVLNTRPKPTRLVPIVSRTPEVIAPEPRSPRTEPASRAVTPGSTTSTERTHKTLHHGRPGKTGCREACRSGTGSRFLERGDRPLPKRPFARPFGAARRSRLRRSSHQHRKKCNSQIHRRNRARDSRYPRSDHPERTPASFSDEVPEACRSSKMLRQ